jgi:hypothetical protein
MRTHLKWFFFATAMVSLSSHLGAVTGPETSGVGTSAAAQEGSKASAAKKATARQQMRIKLGPLQTGPQAQNPAAASVQMTITSTLQQQRQAADAEAAQMKLGIRTQAKPASKTANTKATAAQPTTLLKTTPSGMLGPEKTMDSPVVSPAHAPQFSDTALVCARDSTMRILTVSGKSQPATFTSDDRFNFYTIAGCSFGNPGPNAKVWIYYQNTFHEQFQVQQWNENGIQLNLPPNLRGLLDQDNLTLVVQRADGQQATKGGFKFHAARETRKLASFPRNQFSLWQLTLNDTSHLVPIYVSPSSNSLLPNVGEAGIPGYMAEVYWTCTNCLATTRKFNNLDMQGNEDVWQFKTLQPGFVLQNAGLAYRPISCGGAKVDTQGTFGAKIVGNELHVQWQGQTCVEDCGGGGLTSADCFTGDAGSDYVVWAFVTGPRGVDPWTGKPVQ